MRAELIVTGRSRLEPLRVSHAEELVDALADPALYHYTGGDPATVEQLRARFDLKAGGRSADGLQTWLNWAIRSGGTAVGFFQATLTPNGADIVGELAWVVGVPYQRQGLAGDAATAVAEWLTDRGVRRLIAHIHPGNIGSQGVARRLGLRATDVVVDGETEWVRPTGPPAGP